MAEIIMKSWKKTLPFILLNIAVSAATLLVVLHFWQRQNPLPKAEPTQPIITPIQVSQPTSSVTQTAQITQGQVLRIEGVFGAGDIQVEYILLRNPGRKPGRPRRLAVYRRGRAELPLSQSDALPPGRGEHLHPPRHRHRHGTTLELRHCPLGKRRSADPV